MYGRDGTHVNKRTHERKKKRKRKKKRFLREGKREEVCVWIDKLSEIPFPSQDKDSAVKFAGRGLAMAEHLASIFGTEKDRVNCPFYFKIGACRHGDRCSRLHNRPTISPTLLLSNMYQRPDMITPGVDAQGQPIDPRKIQEHFEDFYEDIFEELSKFGEIECLNVCDNLADHMIGNVYVQFREEEQAAAALHALQGRFYSGRPIIVEFSPVTDFREATCRQFEENNCNRGGYCNFMHVKLIGRDLRNKLFGRYRRRSRSRSFSPIPHLRSRHRRDGDRDYRRSYRDRDYERSRRTHSRSSTSSRSRTPVREGSEERRARIEQWNREREENQWLDENYVSPFGNPTLKCSRLNSYLKLSF